MKLSYNDVLKTIPDHLQQYIVDQDYSRYTPIDQATWRFSLRQLKYFLSQNAYDCYIEGLTKTGITVEEIPRIEIMCEKLQNFGWYALPVSGFIPPAAFMELQSLSILPIASDMRSMDHILYTPAPDIVHEAAGHAPILVDPAFAAYLKSYASVAKKAIISSEDLAQYEAIRDLSDLKEDPNSTELDIQKAEQRLQKVSASMSHISEAALLGRMNWWTAEYGLIGDLESPKIFGAGLLSSVGEARSCLTPETQKIPLTVDCIQTSYDITEKQPQLFVAQTFADLERVLQDLESQMAFRMGGELGLNKALAAKTVNTVQLDSGLQISGQVVGFLKDSQNQISFLRFTGPCQLAVSDQELAHQGKSHHPHGFSSPIGPIANSSQALSGWTPEDFKQHGMQMGTHCSLQFASGIHVSGRLTKETRSHERLILLTWENCTVTHGDTVLFQPEWGTFDMAVGNSVASVFGGPADRKSYGVVDSFVKKVIPRKTFTDMQSFQHKTYQRIRDLRKNPDLITAEAVSELFETLLQKTPTEWLAYIEILELTHKYPFLSPLRNKCEQQLLFIQKSYPEKSEFIQLGLALAATEV